MNPKKTNNTMIIYRTDVFLDEFWLCTHKHIYLARTAKFIMFTSCRIACCRKCYIIIVVQNGDTYFSRVEEI